MIQNGRGSNPLLDNLQGVKLLLTCPGMCAQSTFLKQSACANTTRVKMRFPQCWASLLVMLDPEVKSSMIFLLKIALMKFKPFFLSHEKTLLIDAILVWATYTLVRMPT